MRTTLAIDDDILIAAKAIAQQQDRSLGEVISDLARRSLRRPQPSASRNGILLLPAKYYGVLRNVFQVARTSDEQQVILQPGGN